MAKELHFSSERQRKKYEAELRRMKESSERVKMFRKTGSIDPDKVVELTGKKLGKLLKQFFKAEGTPEFLVRKTMHLGEQLAIPKSPRGRKPKEAHEAA